MPKKVYIRLTKGDMTKCKEANMPVEVNLKPRKDEEEVIIDISSYQTLIGRLIYLIATRLDIMYLINVLNQFMQNLKKEHVIVEIFA